MKDMGLPKKIVKKSYNNDRADNFLVSFLVGAAAAVNNHW